MDWNGAALTLMPLCRGLETDWKAWGWDDGAGGCSDDRGMDT